MKMQIARWLLAASVAVALGFAPAVEAQAPFDTGIVPIIQGVTASTAPKTMTVNCSMVNVRAGPGTNYAILKVLPRGTPGNVITAQNGWIKLEFAGGLKGWIRGDLLADGNAAPADTDAAKARAYVTKSITRWDRHLGATTLSTKDLWWWSRLKRASSALEKGDWQEAYTLAQDDNTNPKLARYLMAKALAAGGKYAEAEKLLKSIERVLEDDAFNQVIDKMAKPYLEEPIAFKFGGFDHITAFRAKKAKGARVGLNSGEYYDKFVDINTWKWKSDAAYKEFQGIAGIDCSGFVQMVEREAFQEAGVSWPISGRTSTSGLWSGKYTKAIDPGYKPPPPPNARPGDLFLLDYGHNRYGHSMIYKGTDAQGNIRVVMMGDTAVETILAPEKYEFFKGAYRVNGMDQVRARLTA